MAGPEDGAPPRVPAPPLHLPVGSVRALLTLSVLGTVWAQLLRDRPVGEELRDTTLLVLGYYFGARAAGTPRPADAWAGPAPDREANAADPLYLPRGAIRLLIVLGFGAVAWKLHARGALLSSPPPLLVLVATFLGGAAVKGAAQRLASVAPGRFAALAGHLAAAATLLVVVGWCALEALGLRAQAPPEATTVFLAVVGFYLGRR